MARWFALNANTATLSVRDAPDSDDSYGTKFFEVIELRRNRLVHVDTELLRKLPVGPTATYIKK